MESVYKHFVDMVYNGRTVRDILNSKGEIMEYADKIRALEQQIARLREQHSNDLKDLEKQLARTRKPKIRNGDYGHLSGHPSLLRVFVRNDENKLRAIMEDGNITGSGSGESDQSDNYIILGNIFDDMRLPT